MMTRVAVVVAITLSFSASGEFEAMASDGLFDVRGETSRAVPGQRAVAVPEDPYIRRRTPATVCGGEAGRATTDAVCIEGLEDMDRSWYCGDGTRALDPLMQVEVDLATGLFVGDWEQVDNGGCPEESVPDVVLTAVEFRRLPLEVRAPVIQPFDGRALVTMGVAAHTDGSAQELMTTVVGVPVRVRATPVQFAWDFGDGSAVIRTTVAGHEWPHHAALGEYPEPGEFQLRLTTTWRGEFQVNGAGPWLPVSGTASTTSDPIAISVETAPARLVSEF